MSLHSPARRHEYIGVLGLLATILLLFCLVSYNPSDSSFNSIFNKPGAENRIGKVGAFVSDLLFQAMGLSAFLLLIPMAVLSWKLIRGRQIQSPYLRTLGLGLLTATTVSLDATVGRLATTESAGPGLLRRFRSWRESRKPLRTVVNIKSAAPAALDLTPRPVPVKPAAQVTSRSEPRPPVVRAHETEAARPSPVDDLPRTRKYLFPPSDLLAVPEDHLSVNEAELMERARQIADKCAEFDVHGNITQIHPGPVVTTFEFKPDAGIKYSKITTLVDDLCLGIKAESIRIDRIPGKATVGMEVPNPQRETIFLREVIESEVFRKSQSRLTLALGRLINGNVYVTDLVKMPHLLIAGATGSGKSVALNCMITSILYKATPEEVKFILIDPKRLELGIYADIPHLLTPIVTDPKEAANALRWATSEMETRYKKLALRGVRNIDQYNTLVRAGGRQLSLIDSNDIEGELEKPLPYLVLVIDELADLMMISSREVEESISRLAAMARAVGIHLILATQRPSVDVITGVIKANFPCRIAFKVATKVDSRTIIDSNGAEQLLGNGDMLFIPPGSSRLTRVHGAFVTEKEAVLIVEHLRGQGRPAYDNSVLTYGQEEVDEEGNPVDGGAQDELYNDAVRIVVSEGRASTSLLQRRLSIGYGRAAKLVDMMYQNNLVGPAEGSKPREVLVGLEFLDRLVGK
jgi:DNA segregation ATPase FtsK/SpoIIIE, S-DNA-T family